MTRTTMRREMNRLRAEIMEGLAEYQEDRESAAQVARCGTVIRDIPANWLRMLMQAAAPGDTFLPAFGFCLSGARRPIPVYLN